MLLFTGLVLSFIFVMFVILLTAIFSALSWDSDSNNHESRWILVAAIGTAGQAYHYGFVVQQWPHMVPWTL
jgi:hypothetical protein